jgi:nucleotide-binding universal stress UspA family protein
MNPPTQQILVGVSGKGENAEALQFAAAEARLRGTGLTVVHVMHHKGLRRNVGSSDDAWQEAGRRVVEGARAQLDALTGGAVATTTLLRDGDAGEVLAELSADATLVVLQHRDLSRIQRIATGSTVATVAAHAHCPVVSVSPARDRAETGIVTVGVHEDGGPAGVVEAAFAEAATHGWSVRLVYAWNVASAYGDMVAQEEHWTTETRASIEAALEKVRAEHPTVPFTIEVYHDWPAEVLARLSADSDLLVVGRHSHHVPLQPRLGSLARSAVTHAECPVMIVSL